MIVPTALAMLDAIIEPITGPIFVYWPYFDPINSAGFCLICNLTWSTTWPISYEV